MLGGLGQLYKFIYKGVQESFLHALIFSFVQYIGRLRDITIYAGADYFKIKPAVNILNFNTKHFFPVYICVTLTFLLQIKNNK